MNTTVRIYYYDTIIKDVNRWDEVCAGAVELFGLPGERFETHVTAEWMDFIFYDGRDATMFMLAHGGQYISSQQLTTEAVGQYFG
jgi:hypothetical protein